MKIIKITDYYGNIQAVPVDDTLYEEWLELKREEDRNEKKEIYHRDGTPFEIIDASDGGDTLDYLIQREETKRLYAAILTLPPDQQRRIYMLLDDMSYADIARIEGRSHPVIRRSLVRAFKHLRQLLAN